MKHSLLSGLLAAALLSASHGAWAHDDATLDKLAAPNGGQLRMAGPYHFELVVAKNNKVATDSPVTVYLTDHAGNKIATAGASGTATLLAGKSKVTAALTAAGDNKFTGMAKYASDPKIKAIVAITFADKKSEQARFTPLAQAAAAVEHVHSGH